jgi:hydrogenase nickel incorporation protein HypB
MCEQCGCALTPDVVAVSDHSGVLAAKPIHSRSVEVLTGILSANDREAAHNREHLDDHGVFAINLMSSPGSGKTSLLETTVDALKDRFRIAVIEGDLETENDAKRIRARGVPAVQITTGQSCHLDAHLVHDALHALDLASIDVLFVENVGNLVCPASFDLGQHANVVLLAVTEGDDKPAKYPVIFRKADLVLLSKTDLLDAVGDFSPQNAESHIRALANAAPVLGVSARRADTLSPWIAWLEMQLAARRTAAMQDRGRLPAHIHSRGPE